VAEIEEAHAHAEHDDSVESPVGTVELDPNIARQALDEH
jgi:hypothetical protein